MIEWQTEEEITEIYRRLHDSLDEDAIMLADMKWFESGIDKYPEDDDRLQRAIEVARELGMTLCQE
jgi:hypothetical protein